MRKTKQVISISRMNRVLELEPDTGAFNLTLTRYTGRFTVVGYQEVDFFLSLRESSITRMWDLVDALTHPDVLHPLYRDMKISPFGDEGDMWLHIKWEGWHADEIKEVEVEPNMKELLAVLNSIAERATRIKDSLISSLKNGDVSENTKVELLRKTVLLMTDCIAQLLPENPYPARGLIGTPFRKLTLGRFNTSQSISIRLSPSEARRLARVIELVARG